MTELNGCLADVAQSVAEVAPSSNCHSVHEPALPVDRGQCRELRGCDGRPGHSPFGCSASANANPKSPATKGHPTTCPCGREWCRAFRIRGDRKNLFRSPGRETAERSAPRGEAKSESP